MYKHLPSPVNFREDINGLRAWAVVGVLLFHFSLIGLPGGFVGVDIFYVISGFLMTSIIVGGYQKGQFSISKFYLARIRRILPALLALIVVVLIFGWFWLPTVEYKSLANQSIYATSFVSNFYFWKETGDYFGAQDNQIWLLHTWSLAIEAQFYILFPVFIAIVWKLYPSTKFLIFLLIISIIISFALSVYLNQSHSQFAFYLLPTRAWELAAGGLVYLIDKEISLKLSIQKGLNYLGWLLILASFILINHADLWPGFLTILPVLGTFLVIISKQADNLLTNNLFSQWIGDRSYSMYLWHWPIVVALIFFESEDQVLWVSFGIFLSLLLAHISYTFIEIPTRKYLSSTGTRKELTFIFIILMTVIVVSTAIKNNDFHSRIPEKVDQAANEQQNFDWDVVACKYDRNSDSYGDCVFDGNGKKSSSRDVPPDVVLLGDSHAQMIAPAVIASAAQHHKKVQVITANGCSFQFSDNPRLQACQAANIAAKKIIDKLDSHIPLIINNATHYIHRYSSDQNFINDYVNTVCNYAISRHVFLVRPLPVMKVNPPLYISRNILFDRPYQDVFENKSEYLKDTAAIWNAQNIAVQKCGVTILDLTESFCDQKNCYASNQGVVFYRDKTHLSQTGALILVPLFNQVFE